MINIIAYPNDTHFLVPLSYLGAATFITELFTYPLDLIK
jgi:hypothetical protein